MLSRKEISTLRSLMSKLSVKPARAPPRPRRRAARQNAANVPAAFSSQQVVAPRSRRNRRQQPVAQNSGGGQITIKRCEILTTLSGKTGSLKGAIPLKPSANALAFLNTLSKSFERVKWHSARIYWRSSVGTTTNGTISYGVDWDSSTAEPASKAAVVSCTPVTSVPLWQSTDKQSMSIPQARLMTRQYYSFEGSNDPVDTSPISIKYWADIPTTQQDQTYGDIWVEYHVTLVGTRS